MGLASVHVLPTHEQVNARYLLILRLVNSIRWVPFQATVFH
jgi:hypothetical protein